MRNIPSRYTTGELLNEIVQHGFGGTIDFFYLPTADFCTKRNKGYCFVNLRTSELASDFKRAFSRK